MILAEGIIKRDFLKKRKSLLQEEMNAFLGFRAIRICLEMKEMFKTQLKAILRSKGITFDEKSSQEIKCIVNLS